MHKHAYFQSMMTSWVNDYFKRHDSYTAFWSFYDPLIDRIYPIQPRNRFPYSTISYMISSEAAQYLVDHVDEHGFVTPVDMILCQFQDLMAGFYVTKEMLVNIPRPADSTRWTSEDSDILTPSSKLPIEGAPQIHKPACWMPGTFEQCNVMANIHNEQQQYSYYTPI